MPSIKDELIAAQREARKLACLLGITSDALRIVSAGIWRNKEHNACGLSGAGVAVHAVEDALAKVDKYIETGDFNE